MKVLIVALVLINLVDSLQSWDEPISKPHAFETELEEAPGTSTMFIDFVCPTLCRHQFHEKVSTRKVTGYRVKGSGDIIRQNWSVRQRVPITGENSVQIQNFAKQNKSWNCPKCGTTVKIQVQKINASIFVPVKG